MRRWLRSGIAGIVGGFVGNASLGVMFSLPLVRRILYDPDLQSRLFLEVTPQRDIPVSVAGLVVLSAVHGWLFAQFGRAIPGDTWKRKGLYWGMVIFAFYWLPQEWFVYHTLLGEPLLLNLLELSLLFVGSLVEGIVIAACLRSTLVAGR